MIECSSAAFQPSFPLNPVASSPSSSFLIFLPPSTLPARRRHRCHQYRGGSSAVHHFNTVKAVATTNTTQNENTNTFFDLNTLTVVPFESTWREGEVVRARGLLSLVLDKDEGHVGNNAANGAGSWTDKMFKDVNLFPENTNGDYELGEGEKRVIKALLEGLSVIYGGRDGEKIVEDIVKRVTWSGRSKRGLIVWTVEEDRVRGCWRRLRRWGVEKCCWVDKNGIGGITDNGRDGNVDVVVTSAEVLRERVFGLGVEIDNWRDKDALDRALSSEDLACVVLDDIIGCSVETGTKCNDGHLKGSVWEDVIIAMPSRVLMLLIVPRLASSLLSSNGTLPLWFQAVQNAVLPIQSSQDTGFDAKEIVIHHPLAQKRPQLVNLQDTGREEESKELNWARDISTMSFSSPSEAQFADVLSMLQTTPPADDVLPATVFIMGQEECETVAEGVFNGLQERIGSLHPKFSKHGEQLLQKRIEKFAEAHTNDLSEESISLLGMLCCSVGYLHENMSPSMISLVLTLHDEGSLGCLVVDSFVRASLLNAIPRAQTVVAQASTIAPITDASRGVIALDTMHSMASSVVVACFYDDSLSMAEAKSMLARSAKRHSSVAERSSFVVADNSGNELEVGPGNEIVVFSGEFCAGYDGILRALKRFGSDGYKELADLCYQQYCKMLESASLEATIRKVEHEKNEMERSLENVDWSAIQIYLQKRAKLKEMRNILEIMRKREKRVLQLRLREMLKSCPPGTKIQYIQHERDMAESTDLAERSNSSFEEEWDGTSDVNIESLVWEDTSCADEKVDHSRTSIMHAIFICSFDLEEESIRENVPIRNGIPVVCIGLDGMWTMISSEDVINICDPDESLRASASVLQVPHLSLFDQVDESGPHGRAIALPSSNVESASLDRLVQEVFVDAEHGNAKGSYEEWLPLRLNEVLEQEERIQEMEDTLEEDEWNGCEERIRELRRIREQSAVRSERIQVIAKAKENTDKDLKRQRHWRDRMSRASLAVLAETNALAMVSTDDMRMTPIGLLAAELHAAHPLIYACFILLTDEIKYVTPAQLAALLCSITTEAVSPTKSKNGKRDVRDVDSLLDVFPRNGPYLIGLAISMCAELDVVERRYFLPPPLTPDSYIPDFQKSTPLPPSMQILSSLRHSKTELDDYRPRRRPIVDTRYARTVHAFVANNNMSWRQALNVEQHADNEISEGELVSVMRMVRAVARQCAGCLQVDGVVREKAAAVVKALERWPIVEDNDLTAVEPKENERDKEVWKDWWATVYAHYRKTLRLGS